MKTSFIKSVVLAGFVMCLLACQNKVDIVNAPTQLLSIDSIPDIKNLTDIRIHNNFVGREPNGGAQSLFLSKNEDDSICKPEKNHHSDYQILFRANLLQMAQIYGNRTLYISVI